MLIPHTSTPILILNPFISITDLNQSYVKIVVSEEGLESDVISIELSPSY
jgi:hypothetical protein